MKQDNGFGLWVWGVMEVVNVAIWAKAANDDGTRWGGDDVPLVADGDFAVIRNSRRRALTFSECRLSG